MGTGRLRLFLELVLIFIARQHCTATNINVNETFSWRLMVLARRDVLVFYASHVCVCRWCDALTLTLVYLSFLKLYKEFLWLKDGSAQVRLLSSQGLQSGSVGGGSHGYTHFVDWLSEIFLKHPTCILADLQRRFFTSDIHLVHSWSTSYRSVVTCLCLCKSSLAYM